MIAPVVMPKLGLTMEEGTVGAWLVKEGEEVTKGQPLFEVLTDKVNMEIESPASGVLRKILAEEGREVPVAEPIAIIADRDEDISSFLESSVKKTERAPSEVMEPRGEKPSVRPSRKRTIASPAAKKRAKEAGVDLSLISGTGPGGRITSEDVQRFIEAARPAEELIPLTRPQKVAAERLSESFRTIPHINVVMDVNAERMVEARSKLLEEYEISYNDILVKAVAMVLKEFPRVNSVLEGDQVRILPEANIGVAVATDEGLMVPVIRNADQKSIIEIGRESSRLIAAARGGRLKLDEISGATFTVTNLGMYGVNWFTAIVNPPQVAILAVGAIERRVVVVGEDSLRIQPMMTLNLACDHRVVNGALGAQFLTRLKGVLEGLTPEL